MICDVCLVGYEIVFMFFGINVMVKLLVLKCVIGNLFDNVLYYGQKVEISIWFLVGVGGDLVEIEICDYGFGVLEDVMGMFFQFYVWLEYGCVQNSGGMGLGLGILCNIVQVYGGELFLCNYLEGGLIVIIILLVC